MGDSWPARQDIQLRTGLTEDEVEYWAQSASLLHSNGDAMDIAVADGRIAGVRGRVADRVNRGRLDPKDLFGWQAGNSPDRLTRPLVRRDGKLVEADWEEELAVAFREVGGAHTDEADVHQLCGRLAQRTLQRHPRG